MQKNGVVKLPFCYGETNDISFDGFNSPVIEFLRFYNLDVSIENAS